VILVWTYNSCV